MEKSPQPVAPSPSPHPYDILLRQMTCDILCALISGRKGEAYTTSYEYIFENDLPTAQELAEDILRCAELT